MRPNVIVTSESYTEDCGHYMSTLLAKGWLDNEGYTTRLLKDDKPQWAINGKQYAPPETILRVVMHEEEVDEISVAGWLFQNVESLVQQCIKQSPSLFNEVYITLKDPTYQTYSTEEVMIVVKVSVLVI